MAKRKSQPIKYQSVDFSKGAGEGSISFTGGNYPDGNTMRIIEPAIASEVMGYLMEGE